MDCGECSIVKRHTLVTKVLRSMPMPSREVMRMAATNPARHRFTTGPAVMQFKVVEDWIWLSRSACLSWSTHACKAPAARTWPNLSLDHAMSVWHMRITSTWHKCTQMKLMHLGGTCQLCVPSLNSSKRTLKAPSMGAQDTSSMGRTVSPSVASKKVAPFAFSLQAQVSSVCSATPKVAITWQDQ